MRKERIGSAKRVLSCRKGWKEGGTTIGILRKGSVAA
jgi:hypothetical protein